MVKRSVKPESARDQEIQTHPANEELGLERIVFFSDAVMAIAITLLAIDLKVPEIAASVAAAELPGALSELAPRFMSFIISFFVIGIYWMSHHRYFRFIKRYDGGLIVLNLLFLVSIPFTFVSRTLAVVLWCTLPLVSFVVLRISERGQRGRRASTVKTDVDEGELQ